MLGLVLSGGGAYGAFQVGVLEGMLETNPELPWYDIFCGVSVGALNGAYLAQYEGPTAAIEDLSSLWDNLDTPDVYRNWFPFGFLQAFWENSFYRTDPLARMISENLDLDFIKTSGKKLRIGAVSQNTGEYRVFDQTDDDLHAAVLASSAFPLMFEPVKFDGNLWVDGGVRNVTPLKAAIDAGATEIDVIVTEAVEASPVFKASPKNLAQSGMQILGTMVNEITMMDLKYAELYNRLLAHEDVPGKRPVNIRIISPGSPLPGSPLDFSPNHNAEVSEIGYEVGMML